MRILFVTPAYPPMIGGGERYVRALALQLAQRGHRITVLTSDARTEQDLWRHRVGAEGVVENYERAVRIIRCAATGLLGGRTTLLAWRKAMVLISALPGNHSALLMAMARYIPAIPTLAPALSRMADRYDLVHAFNLSWEYALLVGWRFARSMGLPFVVTPFTHLGSSPNDRVARNTSMDHQQHLLADAEAVFALTSVEREGLLSWGIAPEHVIVVGSGLDSIPALPESGDLSENILWTYGLRLPIVLFIGRVNRDKGAIQAAEAMRSLQRKGIEATLVLVGQTAPEFKRYYRRLGSQEQQYIRPLGPLDEVTKHVLLRAASMLLLPSRTDSFGIVFLEAWAYGKPVIGARAGGIPGVIDEGRDGLLVDYGDVQGLAEAISRLLSDPVLAQTLGQCGQQKVRSRYSWDNVADQVLAVYGRILATDSRKPQCK